MLIITIPKVDYFDEVSQEFIAIEETTIQLEHSLFSISLWESKWEKAFLGPKDKTDEETIGYIKSMTLTENIPDEVYLRMSDENRKEINEYISAKMTATWFNEKPGGAKNTEVITSELIYSWMVTLRIPFECQHWHLARLLTLIRVINIKNTPPKKMSRGDLAARNRELNAMRQKQLGTSG